MKPRLYSLTAGMIFLLIAVGHLLRILLRLPVMIADRQVPFSASWVALLVTGYMAFEGFRVVRKTP
jgi:hypothetical protein